MLSELVSLIFIYTKQSTIEVHEFNRFQYFVGIIYFLAMGGIILQYLMTFKNAEKKIAFFEFIYSIIGIFLILMFSISFLEFNFNSFQLIVGLLLYWGIECAIHAIILKNGFYTMLNLFISTNVVLIGAEIALKNNSNYANIFEYSSLNLLVLNAQFANSGVNSLYDKEAKNLFTIISRQDCFRLEIYFLLFHIVNNCIKAYIRYSLIPLYPLLFGLLFQIHSIQKFNEKQYKKSYSMCLLTIAVYIFTEIHFR